MTNHVRIKSQSECHFSIVGLFGHTLRITSQDRNYSSILWINRTQLNLKTSETVQSYTCEHIIPVNQYGQFDYLYWARNATLFRVVDVMIIPNHLELYRVAFTINFNSYSGNSAMQDSIHSTQQSCTMQHHPFINEGQHVFIRLKSITKVI